MLLYYITRTLGLSFVVVVVVVVQVCLSHSSWEGKIEAGRVHTECEKNTFSLRGMEVEEM